MPRNKGETLEKGKNQDIKYSKVDFLDSSIFSSMQEDVLIELLENNKKYTIKQCEEILNKEKERKVR